jgi:outer membrane protein assembly factor BamB
VSITASVFCLRCREFAPGIGDCGAVGFPSLKNTAATVTGEYQTFGYLKKGFDAIGYKSWTLEAIAAFLRAHKGHDVSLFMENQDVRYDEWDGEEDEPGPVDDVSDATQFVFDDEDFVEGLFEIACDKCGASLRSGSEHLRPFKPFTLTPSAIRTFMTRVRGADSANFYRVSSLLDYDGPQERFAQFLTDHASHRPKVRIVQGDSAHANPGQAPPWKLAWQKLDPFRREDAPLIHAGRVFAVKWPGVSRDLDTPPAVHCYTLDGDDVWQRDLKRNVTPRLELTNEGVVLQLHATRGGHEMVCLDPAAGDIASYGRTPYSLWSWLPGHRAFVGARHISNPHGVYHVGVVEWPSLQLRWETAAIGITDLRHAAQLTENSVLLSGVRDAGRSPWAMCLDAANGRERWRTSLAEYGKHLGDQLVWRNWLLVDIDTNLLALDLTDGRVAWQCDARFQNWHESDDLLRGHQYFKDDRND